MSLQPHLYKSSVTPSLSSKSVMESSKLKYMIAFIVLFMTPSSDGLSISRSRTALAVRSFVRPQLLPRKSIHGCSSNEYSKLCQTLSNSESTSLDETVAGNINITEKMEDEILQEQEAISQKIEQEKEDLQVAVNEVKEAVVEVSQSAKNLGGAVISNGPGITANFFKLWVSEAFR